MSSPISLRPKFISFVGREAINSARAFKVANFADSRTHPNKEIGEKLLKLSMKTDWTLLPAREAKEDNKRLRIILAARAP